jgi:hypothetical protein
MDFFVIYFDMKAHFYGFKLLSNPDSQRCLIGIVISKMGIHFNLLFLRIMIV